MAYPLDQDDWIDVPAVQAAGASEDDWATVAPTKPPGPAPFPTAAEYMGVTNKWGKGALDFLEGGAAATGKMARGLTQIGNRINPDIPVLDERNVATPPSTAGRAGEVTGDIVNALLPSGKINQAKRVIDASRRIPGVVRLGLKSGAEAVPAAALAGAKTGGDLDSMKWAALAAGGVNLGAAGVGAVGRKVLPKILGATTGTSAEAVEMAAQKNPDFLKAMRGGVNEGQVLDHLRKGMEGVKNQRSAVYQQQLSQLPTNLRLDIKPVRNEMMAALRAHGVKPSLGKNGEVVLDFSRSTISDAAAQNQVLGLVNDLAQWGQKPSDTSVLGVDTLKRRIDDLYSESSNARALVARVKKEADGVLKKVPGYEKMTKDYAEASDFLAELKKELSLTSKGEGMALRKFHTLMGKNQQYRRELVDQLSQHSGRDLMGEIAGLSMSGWMPGKIGIGADMLLTGLGIGHAIPPAAIGAAALTSPRLMGEIAARAPKYAVPALQAAPKVGGAMPQQFYIGNGEMPGLYARGGRMRDPLQRTPDLATTVRALRTR